MKRELRIKKCIHFLTALILMVGVCTLLVQAASGSLDIGVTKLGATFQWNDHQIWPNKATKNDIAGNGSFTNTVTSYYGPWGAIRCAGEYELTLTNQYEGKANLTFNFEVTGYGTFSINNQSYANAFRKGEQPYSIGLEGGKSVTVKMTSSTETDNQAQQGITVKITKIKLEEDVSDVSMTFLPPEQGGSYSVDGEAITANTVKNKKSNQTYRLVATPNAGNVFVGWMGWKNEDTKAYLSNERDWTKAFGEDMKIRPVFVSENSAQFGVGKERFFDLNQANNHAASQSNKTIVLLKEGPLLKDTYTISSGVTLLIPYDDSASLNTDSPKLTESNGERKVFRKLTIPSGATINVDGAICVNGQVLQNKSIPTGPYGLITVESGAQINLNKGANLYCWGYINGDGNVIAKNGSTVYECFQMTGWRGGTASQTMLNKDQAVFLLNQYYIQNVESALTFMYGATEKIYASVTLLKMKAEATESFIAKGAGLFQLTDENSSLTKKYDPKTDRMVFTVNGNMTISSIDLELSVLLQKVSLKSREYVLPIHGGFTVNISSGTTTIDGPNTSISKKDKGQRVCWLPGSELIVAKGATLNVNSDMFVYDRDQWVGSSVVEPNDPVAAERKYAYTADLLPVSYATTRKEKDKRTAAKLTDAKIDVNGTINISGHLYTTARDTNNSGEISDGANITSSLGEGVINFLTNTKNTENTYQVRQGGKEGKEISYDTISCTSAKLRNANDAKGNEQFTLTAGAQAGWTYTYLTEALSANREKYKDMWYLFKVTYIINGVPTVKYITTDSDSFKVPGADASSILKAETKKGTATCSFEGSTLNVSGINAGEDRECTIWITNTKQEFTIKFDGNEPESGKLSGSTNSMTVPMSETTVTLPDCGFTATGWKFVGWSLKKDTAASSTELLKTSATQGQLGNPAAGDEVTLYAIWQPDKVYSVTVSWSKGLEYTYIPNEYTWNATEMRYEHTREAGWIGANDSNPTVTISNGGDKTDVTYGHINAGIQYTPNDAAYNGFTMDFLVDNMSMGKGSATLATKLAPKNSVTTTMKLEGTPFIGMDTGKPITIGTVALTLTTAD